MITLRRRDALLDLGDPVSPRIRHLSTEDREVWFGDVYVLNDDTLGAGTLSPQRAKRDMEAVTYVNDGTYLRVDARGDRTEVPAGSVDLVGYSSGREYADGNADADRPARIIRAWICPRATGWEPRTQLAVIDWAAAENRWLPIVVPSGTALPAVAATTPVRINQEVRISVLELQAPTAVAHLLPRAIGYVLALEGDVHVATDRDAAEVDEGGGARLVNEPRFSVRARTSTARALLLEVMDAVR